MILRGKLFYRDDFRYSQVTLQMYLTYIPLDVDTVQSVHWLKTLTNSKYTFGIVKISLYFKFFCQGCIYFFVYVPATAQFFSYCCR